MFETAGELWKEYLSIAIPSWLDGDPRHSLGGEVRERLRQIDLILRHLHEAIGEVTPDPVEGARRA